MANIGMTNVRMGRSWIDSGGLTESWEGIFPHARRAQVTYNWAEGDLYGDDVLAERWRVLLSADIEFELTEDNQTTSGTGHHVPYVAGAGIERELTDDGEPTGELTMNLDGSLPVGFGFVQTLLINGTKIYRGICFHRVYFHRETEETHTKEENIEWGCPTFKGHAVPVVLENEDTGAWEQQVRDYKDFDTEAGAVAWVASQVTKLIVDHAETEPTDDSDESET